MYVEYIFTVREVKDRIWRMGRKSGTAMGVLTEAIRRHHSSLAKALAAHARAVGGGEPRAERDAFVGFLKGDLLPHARGEERHLYSLVDALTRKHGRPTATMIVEHEFIDDYVTRIEVVTRRLETAIDGERPQLPRQLRDLAPRLDAIVELHPAKEERIYLPLIEEHVEEKRQGDALRAIKDSYEGE